MWLYLPSTSSRSAPAAEGSTLESSWQSQALAQSAWWRGKPSPSRTWSKRLSKVSWLRRLSGRMPEPSTAAHGAALWMASLAESRASHTARPANDSAPMTSEISGPRHGGSSCSPGRGGCSSRTSAGCSPRLAAKSPGHSEFGETYSAWVSRLRADCLRRLRFAQAMNASGCSSLGWPTATSSDSRASANSTAGRRPGARERHDGDTLTDAVRTWPTPTAQEAMRGGGDIPNREGGASLRAAVRIWPTPNATDGEKAPACFSRGPDNPSLPAAAKMWFTPDVPNGGRKLSSNASPTGLLPDGSKAQVGLQNQTISWASSPPVQGTYSVGETCSPDRRSLNPHFVEWLMGWPPGWTLLGWTDFACSATELSRFKRRMRSALSQLTSHAAPPAQLSLFG